MKKKRRGILVLMSTYNGEQYIDEQLESIENQEVDIPLNILIRDDGSTDNTVNIIRKYQDKYHNIELITGKNIGCNASFFELINYAKDFDFYAISDQDDVWIKDKLKNGINEIKKNDSNIPILYGSCSYLVRDDLIPYGKTQCQKRKILLTNSIIQNFIPGHSQIMNAKMLELLKGKIDSSRIYVYDFWITNVAVLFGKVIFSNQPYTYYRMHTNNVIGYGKSKIAWIKERIRRFKKGDGNAIYRQVEYFYEMYSKDMSKKDSNEIKKFLKLNKDVIKRIKFILFTKLYRQKKSETIMFKLIYLLGKYANK